MKILRNFTFVFFLSFINTFGQIPTNGLFAYYPFNGNSNDPIGGFNGVVNGATLTTDRLGNPNSAYYFNGTTQKIVLPSFGNKQKLSISGWFKFDGLNGIGARAIIGSTGVWNYGDIHIIIDDSLGAAVAGQSKYCSTYIVNDKTIGSWNHIVFTYGYEPDSSILYINGRKVSTSPPVKQTLDLTDYNIGYNHNANRFWNGTLDDFRLYDRVLAPNEVTSLFNESTCFKTISVTDTLRISFITGYNDIPTEFGMVKIYPNPSNDVINISVSNPSSNYSVKVINQQSNVVYTAILSNSKIQFNSSILGAKGLYFIQVLDKSNKIMDVKKLIIE